MVTRLKRASIGPANRSEVRISRESLGSRSVRCTLAVLMRTVCGSCSCTSAPSPQRMSSIPRTSRMRGTLRSVTGSLVRGVGGGGGGRRGFFRRGGGAAEADELLLAWGQFRPWPDTRDVLARLPAVPLFIVTNCSERLGTLAAQRAGSFDLVVTAERAGAYKPDPRPYRLALETLGLDPRQVLFVAGS